MTARTVTFPFTPIEAPLAHAEGAAMDMEAVRADAFAAREGLV